MSPAFRTVFDLTPHPERIVPAYWFYAIFVLAGVFLAALAILFQRNGWRRRRFLTIFSIVWAVFCCIMIVVDSRDVATIRRAVRSGDVETVEGCLDYFRPGSPTGTKTTAGNEEWSIGGKVFSYGQGEVRPGYHLVSSRGGAVHPDTRVRVSFVMSPAYGRPEIVKLEVAQHACPIAREVKAFAQP